MKKGDNRSVAGKKPVFGCLSSYLLVLPARRESVAVFVWTCAIAVMEMLSRFCDVLMLSVKE